MSARWKHLCLVVIGQAACLAVGLRMQQHYVQSTVAQVAHTKAWATLEQSAARLFSEPASLEIIIPPSGPPTVGRLLQVLPQHPLSVRNVLVTNRAWQVTFPHGTRDARETDGPLGDLASAETVEWIALLPADKSPAHDSPGGQPLSQQATSSDSAGIGDGTIGSVTILDGRGGEAPSLIRRGRIRLSNLKHIAVSHALKDDQGYLIVHQPLSEIEAEVATLTASLPLLTSMTFAWTTVLLAITAYMMLARLHDEIDRAHNRSQTDTLRQTQHLVRTRDAVIFGLAKLAESRDSETGAHLERICVYATTLAAAARRDPRFSEQITPAFVRLIGISSALHDIGKVGVTDRVLRKRGALTMPERALMEAHTTIGGECLREIEQRLGGSNFLEMARQIAMAHHERWDGAGYPAGVRGSAIPLAGRIVAIADVYDALASKRVYKNALSHEECVALIRAEAGKQLDPDLVEVWLNVEHRFRQIAQEFDSGQADNLAGPSDLRIVTESIAEREQVTWSAPAVQA